MSNDVIADCFVFSSFYFFPVHFFRIFLRLAGFGKGARMWRISGVTLQKTKQKTNRTDWAGTEIFDRELDLSNVNYRRKETKWLAIEELFFRFRQYAKCSNLARFEQVEFHSVHAFRRTPSEGFFFYIKPNWRDKTQLLANICASWSIRNNSPDRRGFALLISFSIVSKSRVISDTITTNWFITEFLLVNGKGDSSG